MKLLPYNAKILKGEILFDGKDITKINETEMRRQVRWKKMSMVFQGSMNAFSPVHTIGFQMAEAMILHENLHKSEAHERVKNLLTLVGIPPSRANNYPHEFSGGMKQRAMIAMALACNPPFVILDEPTTALDVIVQAQVLKLVKELQQKLHLSIMLISHDISVVAQICNNVSVMYAGKVVEVGKASTIFKEPLHPYTKGLMGAFPSAKGPKRRLKSIPGSPPDLLKPPLGCRFHPRCPLVIDLCLKEEPEPIKMADHMVACHLVG